MADERFELVLKAAKKVDELRQERDRLTAEIDSRIRRAEAELKALIRDQPGEPAESSDAQAEPTNQERALDLMRRNSEISVGELALQIYGEDSDRARTRIRSMLYTLRKKGWIEGTDGDFEVLLEA